MNSKYSMGGERECNSKKAKMRGKKYNREMEESNMRLYVIVCY